MNWYLEVLKKYAVFSGRAHRTEYWYFFLINLLISIGLAIIDGMIGLGLLGGLYALLTIIPSFAVGARRLHDTDRSGWWLLIGFVPLLGIIILLIIFTFPGTPGTNRYGPPPKALTEPVT